MSKTALIPELKVLDYQKSLEFYTKLAGFVIAYERPEEHFAMLERDGACLMIEALNNNGRSWLVGNMEKPFGRGINLQIEVQDVVNLYQKFQQSLWPIFLEMEEKWYRVSKSEVGHKQFIVQDPDGYLLRFFEKIELR